MNNALFIKKTIEINSSPEMVWDLLTNPEKIKIWLMGTETITTWKVGDPIIFQGEYQGVSYKDKGLVLEIIPNRLMRYSYWSGFSGTPDLPENYSDVHLEIFPIDAGVSLTVTQTGFADEKAQEHSEIGWRRVLGNLKELAEKEG